MVPGMDRYYLQRNHTASARLNFQNYVWKDALGYNIHPNLPVRSEQDYRIADIGAGTGIWLIDVDRQLPLVYLDGFDISVDQFPVKEWLPGNISLHRLDVFKPVSEELEGKYDMVHVRLFLAVVQNYDPTPILRNLMDMLKPGGYLQWDEYDFSTMELMCSKPGISTNMMRSVMEHGRFKLDYGWVFSLPESFRKEGMEGVSNYVYSPSDYIQTMLTQIHLMVAEEMSFAAMDNSDPEKGGPARRLEIQEAALEAKDGAIWRFSLQVTVGQKPE